MKLWAGDTLTFGDGLVYTVPQTGRFTVTGNITMYNNVPINIDWTGVAKDEAEAIERAISEIQASLGMI